MNSPRLLYEMIFEKGETNPDFPAILSPAKETISFRILSEHLHTIALQLTRLGVQSSDRLALVLPNGPEMASAFLAVSTVCTCAPFNPAYTYEDFKFGLQDLHIKALITSFGTDHPSRKAAVDLGIAVIDLEEDANFAGIFKLHSPLPVDESLLQPVLAGVDNVALVLHTSGTTSRPKIVPLTHRNIYFSVQNIADGYALQSADRCLNMMPLFHIHGLIASVAASLASGASVICTAGFSPEQALDWFADLTPTWYTAVPTIHQALMDQVANQPEITRVAKLRFIRSCSSPLPPPLAHDLESAFGSPVLEAYGMTEATHQMASNPLPPQKRKSGSVGAATGTTQISIRNEQGDLLSVGETGEICIRGENVIAGYENNPKANETSFVKGWLRTGDLGYLDEDNYLFIKGRLKEQINRGGEKVSPREIDEVLLQHSSVKQVVTFAVPHPSLGEDVAVAVVLKLGKTATMQELRQFAADRLADFKVPSLIVFVPAIPKGATGKIQRIGLAEKLKEELAAVKTQEKPAYIGRASPAEMKLIFIWQQVLNQVQIGVQDDFFTLGGNSIKLAQILMMVQKEFDVNISLKEFFAAPTITSLANLIQEKLTDRHD